MGGEQIVAKGLIEQGEEFAWSRSVFEVEQLIRQHNSTEDAAAAVVALFKDSNVAEKSEPVAWIYEYWSGHTLNKWLPEASVHRPVTDDTIRNIRPLFAQKIVHSHDY